MTAAVIRGEFADFKSVKTRSVVQFVIEVPVEEADRALSTLGGLPIPGRPRWVALALLDPKAEPVPVERPKPARPAPDREPRKWRTLSAAQQAGMLCNDPEFVAWVGAKDAEAAAVYVRTRCRVSSRSQLDRDPAAAEVWSNLSRAFFIRADVASQEAAYRRTAE